VVGDDIFASFAMDSGVNVTFRSRVGLDKSAGPFGMEIIGTRGIAHPDPQAAIALDQRIAAHTGVIRDLRL
jgi:hypothetical protein